MLNIITLGYLTFPLILGNIYRKYGQELIYGSKSSIAITAPISTKLSHSINLYKHFVYQILYKSNDICKSTGKSLLMSLRKVLISPYWFSKKSHIWNSTGWRQCMPNAIQIGHNKNSFMPKAQMQLSMSQFLLVSCLPDSFL